ncbi:MAG: PhoH family protein [Verrucomicrobia bacterium]|nr:PhoH family protein [Verrucomicrobiota bacterium]MBU4291250.1 PhoH family protein [Verrucomicrobiota bacterium]MBU4429888.1 PhoH family protein [Verrucomicrobiota bacterium]MCG2678701.1 PhoH family protein [Kiritimatiellia bacterium]
MKKTFVLDTNVLLHNSNCIESFADNVVVLPMAVIEELDKFKSNNDELGRNARQVIRRLDRLRRIGRLGEGVPMENGGILRIITDREIPRDTGLDEEVVDNKIIRVAYHLKKTGQRVIFVSKDINARLKSDALGIETMDFEKQKVNFDDLFTGYRKLAVSRKQMDELNQRGDLQIPNLELLPNEFVVLAAEDDENITVLARAQTSGALAPLSSERNSAWNIKARSQEQRMALELLLDEKVSLVTLVGQAGTGKTLLALAAGLEQTLKVKRYDKMLVSRPIMPLGKDIGFLPGDKDTKLQNWMQPIFDNLAYLIRATGDPKHSIREKIERLQRDHIVELEALTYIRGRSIPKQYVIIDEAQNLTPHEVKTIISRAGEGTKMVLTGDPSQIDNPYLDSNSNGLTYTVERMKSMALHGHVTLRKSERSILAATAAELL